MSTLLPISGPGLSFIAGAQAIGKKYRNLPLKPEDLIQLLNDLSSLRFWRSNGLNETSLNKGQVLAAILSGYFADNQCT